MTDVLQQFRKQFTYTELGIHLLQPSAILMGVIENVPSISPVAFCHRANFLPGDPLNLPKWKW